MQSWWRYYHAPGVGHCGGGVGANPVSVTLFDGNSQAFDDLVKWVETGIPPQSAGDSTKLGILATGSTNYGTRPVCPWPTTAVYSGTGSTKVAANYNCQGNIENNVTGVGQDAPAGTITVTAGLPVSCLMLHTVYGDETSNRLNNEELGIDPALCPAKP
jgi:hypothetical protein